MDAHKEITVSVSEAEPPEALALLADRPQRDALRRRRRNLRTRRPPNRRRRAPGPRHPPAINAMLNALRSAATTIKDYNR